jgi:glycosyltransferase involved in cell wall biosynthesis
VIVNDASTDDTKSAIEALSVDHRYYEFETNQGPAEARNRGVREASGEIIAFLDVDDLWPPGRLELLVKALLANPAADFVRGRAQVFDYDEAAGTYRATVEPKKSFPFYLGGAIYRRSAFLRNGPFDPTFRFGEDSDWHLRAYENGLVCLPLEDVTLHVRRHTTNMTRGKTYIELNAAGVFKARLERQRAREET